MKHHTLDNTPEQETEWVKCVCCLNYNDPTLKAAKKKRASPEKKVLSGF